MVTVSSKLKVNDLVLSLWYLIFWMVVIRSIIKSYIFISIDKDKQYWYWEDEDAQVIHDAIYWSDMFFKKKSQLRIKSMIENYLYFTSRQISLRSRIGLSVQILKELFRADTKSLLSSRIK